MNELKIKKDNARESSLKKKKEIGESTGSKGKAI